MHWHSLVCFVGLALWFCYWLVVTCVRFALCGCGFDAVVFGFFGLCLANFLFDLVYVCDGLVWLLSVIWWFCCFGCLLRLLLDWFWV